MTLNIQKCHILTSLTLSTLVPGSHFGTGDVAKWQSLCPAYTRLWAPSPAQRDKTSAKRVPPAGPQPLTVSETTSPTNQDIFCFFFSHVTTNPNGQPFHQSFPKPFPKMVSNPRNHPPNPTCLQRRPSVQPRRDFTRTSAKRAGGPGLLPSPPTCMITSTKDIKGGGEIQSWSRGPELAISQTLPGLALPRHSCVSLPWWLR